MFQFFGPFTGLVILVAFLLVIVIVKTSRHRPDNPSEGTSLAASLLEKLEEEELSKITILLENGTALETFTALKDSIDYDGADGIYIEFDTRENKHYTYMLGTYSVKIEDL